MEPCRGGFYALSSACELRTVYNVLIKLWIYNCDLMKRIDAIALDYALSGVSNPFLLYSRDYWTGAYVKAFHVGKLAGRR